uniref:Tr-type G domain-containing protein n=1 Tax=Timema shepardi TaxID=629360 RepID=A0A7R9B1H9_TIMSH|nr:unnamed protein product [Timema shepardi]
MDGTILVVAATDGQMPQTIEHLLLAKQTGVKSVVVFINKVDQVDEDVIELIEIEIRELLSDFGYDGINSPIICGSALLALQGDTSEIGEPSIRRLLSAIDEHIPNPVRDYTSPSLLPIDNAFTVPGRGTVVIGTLYRGTLKKNAEVELLGFDENIKTTVSDVQIFKRSVPEAKAGDNIGALLRGVRLHVVRRGMLLCASGSEKLSNHYEAKIYFLSRAEGGRSKPVMSRYIQQLFSKTWNISCRVDISPDVGMIMPGEHAPVYLTLMRQMVMTLGQPFTIRENNATVYLPFDGLCHGPGLWTTNNLSKSATWCDCLDIQHEPPYAAVNKLRLNKTGRALDLELGMRKVIFIGSVPVCGGRVKNTLRTSKQESNLDTPICSRPVPHGSDA